MCDTRENDDVSCVSTEAGHGDEYVVMEADRNVLNRAHHAYRTYVVMRRTARRASRRRQDSSKSTKHRLAKHIAYKSSSLVIRMMKNKFKFYCVELSLSFPTGISDFTSFHHLCTT